MADPLCYAVFSLLGFAGVCTDSMPLRCERYARIVRTPAKARVLEDWFDRLPDRMDPEQMRAESLRKFKERPTSSKTLDRYVVALDVDLASLGLDPVATEAAVSIDPVTGALLSASITDDMAAYFVFPAERAAIFNSHDEFKVSHSGKLGMFCYERD